MRFGPRSCRFSCFHSMWTCKIHVKYFFTAAKHFFLTELFLLPAVVMLVSYQTKTIYNIFTLLSDVTDVWLEMEGGSVSRMEGFKAWCLFKTEALTSPAFGIKATVAWREICITINWIWIIYIWIEIAQLE